MMRVLIALLLTLIGEAFAIAGLWFFKEGWYWDALIGAIAAIGYGSIVMIIIEEGYK